MAERATKVTRIQEGYQPQAAAKPQGSHTPPTGGPRATASYRGSRIRELCVGVTQDGRHLVTIKVLVPRPRARKEKSDG